MWLKEVTALRRVFLTSMSFAFLCAMVLSAGANPIAVSWGLHWAGTHETTNTCTFNVQNCTTSPKGEVLVGAPAGPGSYDVYVLLFDTGSGITRASFGLCCEGDIQINGWTMCSDLEFPTAGWPGCGEADSLVWAMEQPDHHVTVGILEVEVIDGTALLCVCPDPRSGWAGYCHGTDPDLWCGGVISAELLGCVGFGTPGYNPCDLTPTEEVTWGRIKTLYR